MTWQCRSPATLLAPSTTSSKTFQGWRPLTTHDSIPGLAAVFSSSTSCVVNKGADLPSFDVCVAIPHPLEDSPRSEYPSDMDDSDENRSDSDMVEDGHDDVTGGMATEHGHAPVPASATAALEKEP